MEFGKPQAVVSVYVYQLSKLPLLKRHISQRFISYSGTISALRGVFRSLHHHPYLPSASLLGQATQKIPPKLKGSCSMHIVKKNWNRPTSVKFKDWLKNKAEAHERIKLSSVKPKTEDSNPSAIVIRMKTGTKKFASGSSNQTTSIGDKADIRPLIVLLVKKSNTCGVVRCSLKRRLSNRRN